MAVPDCNWNVDDGDPRKRSSPRGQVFRQLRRGLRRWLTKRYPGQRRRAMDLVTRFGWLWRRHWRRTVLAVAGAVRADCSAPRQIPGSHPRKELGPVSPSSWPRCFEATCLTRFLGRIAIYLLHSEQPTFSGLRCQAVLASGGAGTAALALSGGSCGPACVFSQ